MSLVPPTVGSLLSSTGRPLTSQSFLHRDRRRAWMKPPADFQHTGQVMLMNNSYQNAIGLETFTFRIVNL
jgi:hypothetical protein